jgi:thiamine pyrophosphokinase
MDAGLRTAIVVSGGEPLDPSRRRLLREAVTRPAAGDVVIAADSGLDRAAELELDVDLVVGDLDSANGVAVEAAVRRGVELERHPKEKDAIDLELAIEAARRRGARRVVVIDGGGGRLDLAMANLLLLAAPAHADLAVEAMVGTARVHVVRDELVVRGEPGERLSLLPVHGPAKGVLTEGLRYPLDHEDLAAGTTRGCSNELLADTAWVALEEGTLLCILPGPR